MDTKVGRLYSRKNGWENGVQIKCFHSDIIDHIPPLEDIDLQGKSSFEIINYLVKKDKVDEFNELYRNCQKYSSWYFYYGEFTEIFSQESH